MSTHGSGDEGQVPINPGHGPPPQQPPQQPMYGQQPPGYGPQPGYPPQGYGQAPQQPPYGYAPPPPPKKKGKTGRVIVIVVAVVALLGLGGVIIAVATSGGGSTGSSSGGGNPNPTAGLNQAARDGNFEFVVQKVTCGIASVGNSTLSKPAQGQFCEVEMTVKNIGNDARLFDASNQRAFDAAGQRYAADVDALFYLGDLGNAFLTKINPGNQVAGLLVFDIPEGQTITKLELHDSLFSGGVTVNVS
jgi:hypothetical protein